MAFSKSIRRVSPPPYRKEVYGVLFFAAGFFVSLCLLSYSPTDPGFHAVSNNPTIGNLGGMIGAYLSDFLFNTFGLCAYAMALLFLILATLKFRGQTLDVRIREGLYSLLTLIFIATLLQLHFPIVPIAGQNFAGGGIIGSLFGEIFLYYLNRVGAEVIAWTGFLLFFILATQIKISSVAANGYRLLRYFGGLCLQGARVNFERSKKIIVLFGGWIQKQFLSIFTSGLREVEVKIHSPRRPALVPVKPVKEAASPAPAPKEEPAEGSETGEAKNEPKIFERIDTDKKSKESEQLRFLKISGSGFSTPPLSLLDYDKQKTAPIDEEVLKKNARMLELKLLDYEVEGVVTEIHPGPVITMYEFEPKAGTKVAKIVNLESDLSLSMGGKSIRVVPHLPGKAALGIEIPNHEKETVWLKEVISSPMFQKSKSLLTLSLGRDTKGHPVVTDLTKMPHLLMAGATGSGKSVGINSMIISMLYKASPQEVRFILVDPKRLELNAYADIPHLLLPVVTEPKQAVAALKWAVKEMERRYRLLADVGTRNISTYNEKVERGDIELVAEEEARAKIGVNKEAICHTGKLYYLVIIIDELADMMMVASQEFEETITRLAQMARAAGIHLILATQRPSVDVITGLIKANFPARISYKVSGKHDSRIILDQIGSETLLGSGDMLFLPPASSNLVRIHGAYITESEIARVVGFLKEQGQAVYDATILEAADEKEGEPEDFDEIDAELYDKAVRLVAETKQASISMIQRRLRIGYNRAARMVERMEAEGVVGPQDGSKPRQVLVAGHEGT